MKSGRMTRRVTGIAHCCNAGNVIEKCCVAVGIALAGFLNKPRDQFLQFHLEDVYNILRPVLLREKILETNNRKG
jgi:hypothetical protein